MHTATMAMHALAQLCEFAPQYLAPARRTGWSGDAAIFGEWLNEFLRLGERRGWLSVSQILPVLVEWLQEDSAGQRQVTQREEEVLIVGFDHLTGTRQRLLDLVCRWRSEEMPQQSGIARYWTFPDQESEITACFDWICEQAESNPFGRWLIVAPRVEQLRGRLERAMQSLRQDEAPGIDAEFTLGVPLASIAMIRAARMMLRWLSEPLDETEFLWLLSTGRYTSSPAESADLRSCYDALQQSEMARTEWSLTAFCEVAERLDKKTRSWCMRIVAASNELTSETSEVSTETWAESVRQFLRDTLWIENDLLDSIGYQASQQFDDVLDDCAVVSAMTSMSFSWPQFLRLLQHQLENKTFTPERVLPQLQITAPAESAGLAADGIWFLQADSSQWPGVGNPNPLLPLAIQMESAMPHSTLAADASNALAVTRRLMRMAYATHFSFAELHEDGARFPSSPVMETAGMPETIGTKSRCETDATERLQDTQRLLLPAEDNAPPLQRGMDEAGEDAAIRVTGGAALLSDQSQCAFRSFARYRLGVRAPSSAEPGISARLRGRLLHDALRGIWSGRDNGGLRTLDDLLQCIGSGEDGRMKALVRLHVARAFDRAREFLHSETIVPALTEIERERMEGLLCEWLKEEAKRLPFSVEACEETKEMEVAGLRLRVRQDRVDRVNGGVERYLIVDYKTSPHKPNEWMDDRPDDVQLPLYALHYESDWLEGLVFANVVASEADRGFQGMVRNVRETLLADAHPSSSMMKNPLTSHQLLLWRKTIEVLAQDYLRGVATVNPKSYPESCKYCRLHALCRVTEERSEASEEDSEDD